MLDSSKYIPLRSYGGHDGDNSPSPIQTKSKVRCYTDFISLFDDSSNTFLNLYNIYLFAMCDVCVCVCVSLKLDTCMSFSFNFPHSAMNAK